MIYKSTSIREVIGRVVRNTRVQDASYTRDMEEWIPEAMGYMKTKVTLSPQWKDLTVDFHKAKLPCGLKTLSAVAYGCSRMRFDGSAQPYGQRRQAPDSSPVFISTPTSTVESVITTNRNFSADTTLGGNWAIDTVILSDDSSVTISRIIGEIQPVVDIAALSATLNNIPNITFEVSWDGDTLLINTIGDGIYVAQIVYHRVTLDAPDLYMVILNFNQVENATRTASNESITTVELCCNLVYGAYTYYTEMDWINTSLCDGTIRIFYKALPTDEYGFPLIPDNEDYKEAIYWYVRGKMIGTGYKDTVYDVKYCDEKFWHHAARAMGQIRYPSVDKVETWTEISTRLILPDDYFETFFANPGKEGTIDM